MRIKIYNKEGFDWANKKVYLYKGDNGNNEKINSIICKFPTGEIKKIDHPTIDQVHFIQ